MNDTSKTEFDKKGIDHRLLVVPLRVYSVKPEQRVSSLR